jgi:REP-associated tyrosine transposase
VPLFLKHSVPPERDGQMPRLARIVVPGYPHHVTQRGGRRQLTFFDDFDYRAYIELIASLKRESGVDIWAYCLMPNHVHFVVVPQSQRALARLFGIAHHRYAARVNAIHGWQGHLWQERFHSFVMDETHLISAVRYIEMNPVRAGLCTRADEWRWSSARPHLQKACDPLLDASPLSELVPDWRQYLNEEPSSLQLQALRQHTRTGRPAGDENFVEELERLTGTRLRRRKPGPQSRK